MDSFPPMNKPEGISLNIELIMLYAYNQSGTKMITSKHHQLVQIFPRLAKKKQNLPGIWSHFLCPKNMNSQTFLYEKCKMQ